MLGSCAWLALEVTDRDEVADFYREWLDLTVAKMTETETVLDAGVTSLVLRRPETVPRGGLHTHFACSIPAEAYDEWWDRLADSFDLTEMDFGGAKSLYFDDPAGNCVELGQSDVEGPGIDGIFEIVLEVANLERAVELYTALGFEVVDEGQKRRRTRLTTGSLDLELWEPQLGIADARGGVHVDWGLRVDDPATAVERVRDRVRDVQSTAEGVRLQDPDGHYLTLVG